VSSDLHLLTNSRFETAKLRGKLACLIGETEMDEISQTQLIKRATSGKDTIPVEYKNKQEHLDYINFAKFIMATNNLPPTNDKTAGWGRRWCIIDFPNTFEKEIDILKDIDEEQYENLCLKSINYLINLLKKRNFHKEGDIQTRMKNYEEKSNPLKKFFEENCSEDFDGFITKSEFRRKLLEWLKENRFREISDRSIIHFMADKGIKVKQKTLDFTNDLGKNIIARVWEGIKWK